MQSAMRLLYILSGQKPIFDRKKAEESLKSTSTIATVLQFARDSLSQKRSFHISFLLETLYEQNFSIEKYFQLIVPQSFSDSVREGLVRIADQLACQAHWCAGYHRPGKLIKTGTTTKRQKSGEVWSYYMACTHCGCEYAVDERGELKERTYFIEGYQQINHIEKEIEISAVEVAASLGVSYSTLRNHALNIKIKEAVNQQKKQISEEKKLQLLEVAKLYVSQKQVNNEPILIEELCSFLGYSSKVHLKAMFPEIANFIFA